MFLTGMENNYLSYIIYFYASFKDIFLQGRSGQSCYYEMVAAKRIR